MSHCLRGVVEYGGSWDEQVVMEERREIVSSQLVFMTDGHPKGVYSAESIKRRFVKDCVPMFPDGEEEASQFVRQPYCPSVSCLARLYGGVIGLL